MLSQAAKAKRAYISISCARYKAEAVAILRELAKIHSEIAFAEIVKINKLPNSDQYELKIKCVLDVHGRESINEFLKKENFKMRAEEGFIIIYCNVPVS